MKSLREIKSMYDILKSIPNESTDIEAIFKLPSINNFSGVEEYRRVVYPKVEEELYNLYNTADGSLGGVKKYKGNYDNLFLGDWLSSYINDWEGAPSLFNRYLKIRNRRVNHGTIKDYFKNMDDEVSESHMEGIFKVDYRMVEILFMYLNNHNYDLGAKFGIHVGYNLEELIQTRRYPGRNFNGSIVLFPVDASGKYIGSNDWKISGYCIGVTDGEGKYQFKKIYTDKEGAKTLYDVKYGAIRSYLDFICHRFHTISLNMQNNESEEAKKILQMMKDIEDYLNGYYLYATFVEEVVPKWGYLK